MAICPTPDRITSDLTDVVAEKRPDDRWVVTGRDSSYAYNQAITALVLAEKLARGVPADNPHIQGWERELAENQED